MARSAKKSIGSLTLKGHLLIAMPGMEDSRFARTVILICSHSKEGSMGFILNQPIASPSFDDILEELSLDADRKALASNEREVPIFRGGPVEQGRGFVVHTLDFSTSASARVDDLAGVTATLDALKALVGPKPPESSVMLLGYAGWGEGQLEEEIAQNGWLTCQATKRIVFETHYSHQYDAALAAMGITEATLSATSGHA